MPAKILKFLKYSTLAAVVPASLIISLVALSSLNTPVQAARHTLTTSKEETEFLAENGAAMKKMMVAMEINASGNVDHDFVAMMVPHHQGAINMAQAELLYGHNEQLRRIAQGIIIEQQQEIDAMQLALNQSSSYLPSPNQSSSSSSYADNSNTQSISSSLIINQPHLGGS